jgi:predicted ABC-type ATPase
MVNSRPVLVVVAGPNGSGKTTLTTQVLEHRWLEGCVYVNADNIAQQEFGDWNSADAVLKAARRADELREDCLRQRRSLAYETVFSTPGRLEFIARATDAGYFIRLFFVGTEDPAINVRRVAQRVREGGHDVPTDKIIARHARAMANLAKAITLVDRAYVYDNTLDNREMRLLFRTRHGALGKVYDVDMPVWAQTVLALLEAGQP